MAVTTVLVTSCTQRKTRGTRLDVANVPQRRNVEQVAKAWNRVVGRATPVGPALALYRGRSIADTMSAAAHLGATWYVVSAGLGLVHSAQAVPSYECTVASGSELEERLRQSGATASDWWNAITALEPRPLSRLIARTPTLLALPGTYLQMVHDDLAHLPISRTGYLRIFTSPAGARWVPEHLSACVMPYDDRLESLRKFAGTRADFAQRALRHFVEELSAASLPLDVARLKVSAALAHTPLRVRPTRRRMTDVEVTSALKAAWTPCGGSSSKLLRYLRDEARISCEQKRFGRLWRTLAMEMQT